MDLTLRDAQPGDRALVHALFAALQEAEREMEPNRLPGDQCGPHVDWLLDWAAEGGMVLIAELGGVPVGLLIAGLRDDGAYVLPENRIVGEVSDLYVAPEARRRGVAMRLLAEAEARFAAQGVRRMEISTLAANAPAAALYRRWAGAPQLLTFARAVGAPPSHDARLHASLTSDSPPDPERPA